MCFSGCTDNRMLFHLRNSRSGDESRLTACIATAFLGRRRFQNAAEELAFVSAAAACQCGVQLPGVATSVLDCFEDVSIGRPIQRGNHRTAVFPPNTSNVRDRRSSTYHNFSGGLASGISAQLLTSPFKFEAFH
jgi:hypothetical protein